MGFASGFAGERNNGIGEIMRKVLVGLAVGAVIGAVSGYTATPKHSPAGSASPAAGGMPPAVGPGPGAGAGGLTPPPGATNLGDATAIIAGKAAAKAGQAVAGPLAQRLAPYARHPRPDDRRRSARRRRERVPGRHQGVRSHAQRHHRSDRRRRRHPSGQTSAVGVHDAAWHTAKRPSPPDRRTTA
jgi:hypothetical protein